MALSDFYAVNSGYKTRVSLSVRNSRGEPLLALASAVDLLQTVGVEAIISGNSLQETKILAEIGDKAKAPVMSNVSATLLEAITECRFKGLSGDFHIKHKKLLSNKFGIVNLIGSDLGSQLLFIDHKKVSIDYSIGISIDTPFTISID
ncbi:hypothetical protein F2Q69_00058765 [Brassica cretica]|uniref:Receptor ligand binding region domain-containing protein n=1 Tax=Brassica cretica TaxID=69181 RepID=A0A8S9RJ51_BRACR|nr:hypothetical protein F2Q69_00058765 [Brassica cretica]